MLSQAPAARGRVHHAALDDAVVLVLDAQRGQRLLAAVLQQSGLSGGREDHGGVLQLMLRLVLLALSQADWMAENGGRVDAGLQPGMRLLGQMLR